MPLARVHAVGASKSPRLAPACTGAVSVTVAVPVLGMKKTRGDQGPQSPSRPTKDAPDNTNRATRPADGPARVVETAVTCKLDLDTAPRAGHDDRSQEERSWSKLKAFRRART